MRHREKSGLIFIDWDGTLSHGRFWSSFDATTFQIIQQSLFENNKALVVEWMLGHKNAEQICEWLAAETGLEIEALLGGLTESCEQMRLSPELRDLIGRARKQNYVVLVTDNMDCFTRFTVHASELEKYFDHLINSADVGRLKLHELGLTFRMMCDQLRIPISHSFLIDDSEKTCNLFHELGGKAYRTSGLKKTEEILKTLIRARNGTRYKSDSEKNFLRNPSASD